MLRTGEANWNAGVELAVTIPVDGLGEALPVTREALVQADFVRDGGDLVIHFGPDEVVRITDYFRIDQEVDLTTIDGAILNGDLVAKLALPEGGVQVAQVGAPAGAVVVGRVEIATGTVTATRQTGEVVSLSEGAQLFQGDIIETGPGSEVSFTLADGSVFSLTAGGRMVLDQFLTDAAGDGSSMVSVLSGTFSFFAGAFAKSDGEGMTIRTPVAAIGIRGTTGVGTADGEFGLTNDPGTNEVGVIEIDTLAGTAVLTQAGQVTRAFNIFAAPSAPIQFEPVAFDARFGTVYQLTVRGFDLALSRAPEDFGQLDEGAFPDVAPGAGPIQQAQQVEAPNQIVQSIFEPGEPITQYEASPLVEPPDLLPPRLLFAFVDGGLAVATGEPVSFVSLQEVLDEFVDQGFQGLGDGENGSFGDRSNDQELIVFAVAEEIEVEDGPLVLIGTSGDDILIGGRFGDRIEGRGGNDILIGNEGDDIIKGEAGNDVLIGNEGNDRLTGGPGADSFIHNGPGDGIDILDGFLEEDSTTLELFDTADNYVYNAADRSLLHDDGYGFRFGSGAQAPDDIDYDGSLTRFTNANGQTLSGDLFSGVNPTGSGGNDLVIITGAGGIATGGGGGDRFQILDLVPGVFTLAGGAGTDSVILPVNGTTIEDALVQVIDATTRLLFANGAQIDLIGTETVVDAAGASRSVASLQPAPADVSVDLQAPDMVTEGSEVGADFTLTTTGLDGLGTGQFVTVALAEFGSEFLTTGLLAALQQAIAESGDPGISLSGDGVLQLTNQFSGDLTFTTNVTNDDEGNADREFGLTATPLVNSTGGNLATNGFDPVTIKDDDGGLPDPVDVTVTFDAPETVTEGDEASADFTITTIGLDALGDGQFVTLTLEEFGGEFLTIRLLDALQTATEEAAGISLDEESVLRLDNQFSGELTFTTDVIDDNKVNGDREFGLNVVGTENSTDGDVETNGFDPVTIEDDEADIFQDGFIVVNSGLEQIEFGPTNNPIFDGALIGSAADLNGSLRLSGSLSIVNQGDDQGGGPVLAEEVPALVSPAGSVFVGVDGGTGFLTIDDGVVVNVVNYSASGDGDARGPVVALGASGLVDAFSEASTAVFDLAGRMQVFGANDAVVGLGLQAEDEAAALIRGELFLGVLEQDVVQELTGLPDDAFEPSEPDLSELGAGLQVQQVEGNPDDVRALLAVGFDGFGELEVAGGLVAIVNDPDAEGNDSSFFTEAALEIAGAVTDAEGAQDQSASRSDVRVTNGGEVAILADISKVVLGRRGTAPEAGGSTSLGTLLLSSFAALVTGRTVLAVEADERGEVIVGQEGDGTLEVEGGSALTIGREYLRVDDPTAENFGRIANPLEVGQSDAALDGDQSDVPVTSVLSIGMVATGDTAQDTAGGGTVTVTGVGSFGEGVERASLIEVVGNNASIQVGADQNEKLDVLEGGQVTIEQVGDGESDSALLLIGVGAGALNGDAEGVVEVDGGENGGSLIALIAEQDASVRIGVDSKGKLDVKNGGQVTVEGDTTEILVGSGAEGELNVNSGGAVVVGRSNGFDANGAPLPAIQDVDTAELAGVSDEAEVRIGTTGGEADLQGKVVVDGTKAFGESSAPQPSFLEVIATDDAKIVVGKDGTGELEVTNGGQVFVTALGDLGDAQVDIGADSKITVGAVAEEGDNGDLGDPIVEPVAIAPAQFEAGPSKLTIASANGDANLDQVDGDVTINAGAAVSLQGNALYSLQGGSLVITDPGSSLDVGWKLAIGLNPPSSGDIPVARDAVAEVSNGATVNAQRLDIGEGDNFAAGGEDFEPLAASLTIGTPEGEANLSTVMIDDKVEIGTNQAAFVRGSPQDGKTPGSDTFVDVLEIFGDGKLIAGSVEIGYGGEIDVIGLPTSNAFFDAKDIENSKYPLITGSLAVDEGARVDASGGTIRLAYGGSLDRIGFQDEAGLPDGSDDVEFFGDFTMERGSRMEIGVDLVSDDVDVLNVDGNITINGGIFTFDFGDKFLDINESITFLESTGSLEIASNPGDNGFFNSDTAPTNGNIGISGLRVQGDDLEGATVALIKEDENSLALKRFETPFETIGEAGVERVFILSVNPTTGVVNFGESSEFPPDTPLDVAALAEGESDLAGFSVSGDETDPIAGATQSLAA